MNKNRLLAFGIIAGISITSLTGCGLGNSTKTPAISYISCEAYDWKQVYTDADGDRGCDIRKDNKFNGLADVEINADGTFDDPDTVGEDKLKSFKGVKVNTKLKPSKPSSNSTGNGGVNTTKTPAAPAPATKAPAAPAPAPKAPAPAAPAPAPAPKPGKH